ncbi:DNA polymerase delta small subunit [Linum perenne]
MGTDSSEVLQRKQATYTSLDETFEIRNEKYSGQQYSQIYFARLHVAKTLLYSLIPLWKPQIPVCTVLSLEEGKECVIVGTLYKHMKLKPRILDEYSKERSVIPLVKPHNFMSSDDYLILEDEGGRVKLDGQLLLPSVYVTGVIVALLGKETTKGDFLVHEVLEAGLAPQIDRPIKLDKVTGEFLSSTGEDKYVLFVSGLGVGNTKANPLQLQLLVDHITGHLGDEKEQRIAAQIVHVVIAGNSVEIPSEFLNGQNLGSRDQSKLSEPTKELDILLTQIAAGLPLDIIPGPKDPTNFALPQQPLHRCLFPSASSYNTFRSCTNPHCFELDKIRFLGTSGQNIEDMGKYSEAKDELEFMERTLKWRHMAPTTPNTLGCYPFTDRDPFLIESCPHVYFAGNQPHYGTSLLDGPEGQIVRLVSIPKFCETGVAVMLNLRNLECHTVSFEAEFS